MIDSSWHPDDNQCALFLEGALDDVTTNEITRHLATCNDCLEIIGGSAKSLRERALWQRPVLWEVAAGVVIAVVGLALFWQWHGTSGIDAIAAAAPHDKRPVEARLTGFPYARFERLRGAPSDNNEPEESTAQLRLQAAAGDAIERSEKSSSADAAHAAGVGYIILRDNNAAINELKKAIQRNPKDAHLWNDLGAAQMENRQYADALASFAQALRLDPRLPEAAFNRAQVLSDQGSPAALDAWRAYLKLDPNSAWADEARGKIAPK